MARRAPTPTLPRFAEEGEVREAQRRRVTAWPSPEGSLTMESIRNRMSS